jgi:hypothetical protein
MMRVLAAEGLRAIIWGVAYCAGLLIWIGWRLRDFADVLEGRHG